MRQRVGEILERVTKENGKIKIVADTDIPFLKGVLEGCASVLYLPGREIDARAVRDADALLIRTRTRCDESLLGDSPVRFIATASIGYDHIDTVFCDRKGIAWTNAPGCNSSSVEQYMLSTLLNLADSMKFRIGEKTIGIVGVGHVGSKVERICRAMGMRVLLSDPPRSRQEGPEAFVELGRIIEEADIITLHVPLNPSGPDKTWHLAGPDFFRGLKKNPILINTSRGEVVDGKALKQALDSGWVSAAVLDVWEGEPDPDLDLLAKLSIGTAHIAGYSVDGKANATGMSVRALSRFFGLGMDHWSPDGLPQPPNPDIVLDATGMDLREILLEVSRRTYDVRKDDAALRADPGKFERLRASYTVRREPPAYRVKILNGPAGTGTVLEKLGYTVPG